MAAPVAAEQRPRARVGQQGDGEVVGGVHRRAAVGVEDRAEAGAVEVPHVGVLREIGVVVGDFAAAQGALVQRQCNQRETGEGGQAAPQIGGGRSGRRGRRRQRVVRREVHGVDGIRCGVAWGRRRSVVERAGVDRGPRPSAGRAGSASRTARWVGFAPGTVAGRSPSAGSAAAVERSGERAHRSRSCRSQISASRARHAASQMSKTLSKPPGPP